ncbi:MAG: HTH-type transcriptional regulator Xre [Firmicutes bacterium ADurb.BinA205]|nr:MAG: HTH-type transcriptional regulator Xre [Firmicutes bacterium ADurb.BinA205]
METKDIIRSLRVNRKLTLQELADQSGIAKTNLSELENGRRKIGLAILTKLADFYGVTLDYIMGREVTPEVDNRTDIEKLATENNFSVDDEEFLKQNQEQLVKLLKDKQSELDQKKAEIDRLKKRIAELESEKVDTNIN